MSTSSWPDSRECRRRRGAGRGLTTYEGWTLASGPRLSRLDPRPTESVDQLLVHDRVCVRVLPLRVEAPALVRDRLVLARRIRLTPRHRVLTLQPEVDVAVE